MVKGKDTPKAKNKGGRPSTYTPERGAMICKVIATSTLPLQEMCNTFDFFPPNKCTVYEWRYDYKEFSDMFTKAKQEQAELIAYELREIAYNRSRDTAEGKDGPIGMGVHVARDRLIIDTEKWIACKLLPKVYGDKAPEPPPNAATSSEIKEIAEAIKELNAKHERDY